MKSVITSLGTTAVIESDLQVNQNHTGQRQDLTLQILEILNKQSPTIDVAREILSAIKQHTGIEAVGIRLRDGEDYPYYETSGFPESFVKAEMNLCAVDEDGKVIRDTHGNPCLECMCSHVVCGRTDSSLPIYTENGSFWTNSTTKLQATAGHQIRTRNHFNRAGYESVALIPLRLSGDIIGLLQLNDKRPDMFTLDDILFFEKLGKSIGVTVTRKQAEEGMRETTAYLENLIDYANVPIIVWDQDLKITRFNRAFEAMTLKNADEVIGRSLSILFPKEDCREAMAHISRTKNGEQWNDIEIPIKRSDDSVRIVLWNSANIRADKNGSIIATIAQGRDVTEHKRAEEALERKSSELMERIKELRGLYGLSQLTGNTELNPDKVYQMAVELIPPAWRYSETTCGRIIVNGKEYRTANYVKSARVQTSKICAFSECIGSIEVGYLEERPELYEGPFLKEERELIDSMARNLGQYEERYRSESKLRKINSRLIESQIALENKNNALSEIVQHIDQEKRDTGLQIQSNIDRLVVPIVSKLGAHASEAQKLYLSMLESTLSRITSPFVSRLEKDWTSLTVREVEICNLIRSGLASKDIANSLQTSVATVVTQRKTIRKKLGLAKKKINLANYLQKI